MCKLIMIMILLVTAYTGWHRRDYSIGDVQCYSKYLRRPRVRTAPDGVHAVPPRSSSAGAASSGWIVRRRRSDGLDQPSAEKSDSIVLPLKHGSVIQNCYFV